MKKLLALFILMLPLAGCTLDDYCEDCTRYSYTIDGQWYYETICIEIECNN